MLAALLAAACWTDSRTGRIPNWLTLGGAAAGVGLAFWSRGSAGLLVSAGGWLAVLAIVFAIYSTLGMGGGDAKLLAMVAAFQGFERGVWTLFHTLLLGLAVAVPVLAARGRLPAVLRRALEVVQGVTLGLLPCPPGDASRQGLAAFPVAILVAGGALLTWCEPAWMRWMGAPP